MLSKSKIGILGGGITGLAAGIHLSRKGHQVIIFEQDQHVGGLASGKIINDNIYEYGPHFFHTNDPHILREIKNIAQKDLIKFERTILIKFLGNYFIYPLSMLEVLRKLPKKVVLRAILSFIKNNIKKAFRKPKNPNSETVLLGFYGSVLYELFFKNYIYHVWGVYPDKFSPKFAEERIPRISGSIFLNKLISPIRARFSKKSVDKYVENVDGQLYTTKIGYRGIINRMAKEIESNRGQIITDAEVVKVNIDDNKVNNLVVRNNNKEEIDFEVDGVINTIPINELINIINSPVPKEIKESADFLEFRSLVFVGVLVNKPKVLPVSFMYFREHTFNRVYDSSYFSHDTVLPDTTILVAEISSSLQDRWWEDDQYCKEMVLKDLYRENLIAEDDVLEVNVYRYQYGYPIYKLGYEDHLNKILDYINSIENLETAGRQGLFKYINGHIAIKMGFEAADNIIKLIKK